MKVRAQVEWLVPVSPVAFLRDCSQLPHGVTEKGTGTEWNRPWSLDAWRIFISTALCQPKQVTRKAQIQGEGKWTSIIYGRNRKVTLKKL